MRYRRSEGYSTFETSYSTNAPHTKVKSSKFLRNVRYHGEVSLGTPDQKFLMLFDTSSSDSWVTCSACGNGQNFLDCSVHRFFRCDSSTTCFAPNETEFQKVYSNVEINGYMVEDIICFGNDTLRRFCTSRNQRFGCVTEEPSLLTSLPYFGVIGLGWDAGESEEATPTQLKIPTLLQSIFSASSCHDPIIAFWLNRTEQQPSDGEIAMCGINDALHKGPFLWCSIVENQVNYWSLALDSMAVISLTIAEKGIASIDTSSPYISGPIENIDFLATILGAQIVNGTYVIDCAQGLYMPPITFYINATALSIASDEYIIKLSTQQNHRGFSDGRSLATFIQHSIIAIDESVSHKPCDE
ncbi:unnamed protein product [Anisakis simplex]|uniref:Peptidase A1 domain-containing protein n=1 Tax=Anisakis simplex TaxID=6269 RepID=A0A0M3K3U7_ANISI|nr:unnamed protein product [Anisakis simplex]